MKKAGYKVKQVCRLLSVGRSTFYARCKPKPICHEHIRLKAVVRHVHRVMDATYGTRRMAAELCEWGFKVGRYKVRKLMKSLQLVAKRPKQHRYPMSGKPSVIGSNRLTDNSILTA
ncbi:IS3 family transposase [Moellerella wisconsensis]|uniref:IS3 family transposase n=1 Tax=Moellerella wisconsensis TaxID=158849 RepID=UPI0025B0EFC0|nr:IS3 family transposase [Moellerella wisconsensis]WJW83307.1 IS3 family transposase [Moellerella wisconsensis]